ncbi:MULTISPECIES: hypothetical protein [unclassified Sphingobium]|uniref:hypothetical protein n=1 Tax=unclassified Sphingobium TaxID=2611147 RepID=UPI000D168053|nr:MULTISPECIES: hypothetical protein [unclassified Sphingobium]PSO13630.1 hypothetical protein C7E20_00965 [Sphingobium sp. AEW4]TWD10627.1 hypothetical protein FB595_103193 [Sphingobium sp. AEW010]TWD27968.1 hypothetical protein FB596_103122 [Sphingobium sp. AEW013]TWD28961.1 hypothetical protein FB594_103193 [Sphingobium sp. AEW001]
MLQYGLAPAVENGGNAGVPETGTIPAKYNTSKSARDLHEKHGRRGWGGARNTADRTSDAVTLHQAAGVIRAAEVAWAIGLPLNRHVTIHLEKAGVADRDAAKAIGAFLRMMRDWLRKAGLMTAGAWVRENGLGKGSHVHILLHLPTGVRWTFQRCRRWLERIVGVPYRKGVIVTRRIRGSARPDQMLDLYSANLAKIVMYLIKGVQACDAKMLGIQHYRPGGTVIGKRVGWTQNIGSGSALQL